jgi:hypothetical protein
MNSVWLSIAKSLAPALIQALKEYAKTTPSEIDDIGIDTIEFLLKRIKIIA